MSRILSRLFFAGLATLACASVIVPASAAGPASPSACVADRSSGASQIGSTTSASSIEVCLRQARTVATTEPARTTAPNRTTETKRVCTSGTVSVRLGPPSYGVRSYKQTVCNGVSKTVPLDVSPPQTPENSRATGRSSIIGPGQSEPGRSARSNSASQASAVFQPEPHRISPEFASIRVGTRLTLTSLAKVHYRTATVLSEQVSVRFVPVAAVWQIDSRAGARAVGQGSTLELLFDKEGTFQVEVEVLFEPEFQIAGGPTWFRADRGIRSVATAQMVVSAVPTPIIASQPKPSSVAQPPSNSANQSKPRLASKDCIANPKGRGCTR